MLTEAAAQCDSLKVQLKEARRREREQAEAARAVREELRVSRDEAALSVATALEQQAAEARRHEAELRRVRGAAQLLSDQLSAAHQQLEQQRRSQVDVNARLESSELRRAEAETCGRQSLGARQGLQTQLLQQQQQQQALEAQVVAVQQRTVPCAPPPSLPQTRLVWRCHIYGDEAGMKM